MDIQLENLIDVHTCVLDISTASMCRLFRDIKEQSPTSYYILSMIFSFYVHYHSFYNTVETVQQGRRPTLKPSAYVRDLISLELLQYCMIKNEDV